MITLTKIGESSPLLSVNTNCDLHIVKSVLYLEIINTSDFNFNKRIIFFGIFILNKEHRTIKHTKKSGDFPASFCWATARLP